MSTTTPLTETFVVQALAAQLTKLDAQLAEANQHVRLLGLLMEHAQEDIDRRDETIARLHAEADQRNARERDVLRELERVRRVCRAAGVDYAVEVTS